MNDYKVQILDAETAIEIESKTFNRRIEALSYISKSFDNNDEISIVMSVVPAAYILSVNKRGSDGRISMVYVDHTVTFEKAQEILVKYADSLTSYVLSRV